jgi:hypothetical protein
MLWVIIRLAAAIGLGVYSFLPAKHKSKRGLLVFAICATTIVVSNASFETYQKFNSRRYAYVGKDGTILESRNFPWHVKLYPDGVYVIFERYGDASTVSVIPDKPIKVTVYNAMDGIGIKFDSPKDAVPNFRIKIRDMASAARKALSSSRTVWRVIPAFTTTWC